MRACLSLAIVFLLAFGGCERQPNPPAPAASQVAANKNLSAKNRATSVPATVPTIDAELHSYIGQQVTLTGKFSTAGKLGPFVLYQGKVIYLLDRNATRRDFSAWDNQNVSITGVLRYVRHDYGSAEVFDPSKPVAARPPNHFYFEAESAVIEKPSQ